MNKNGVELTPTKKYTSKNFVQTLSDAEQFFDLRTLYIDYKPNTAGSITTCVDKIFAIREFRLNPYIGFAQYAGGTPNTPISVTNTLIDSQFSSDSSFCVPKPAGTTHN